MHDDADPDNTFPDHTMLQVSRPSKVADFDADLYEHALVVTQGHRVGRRIPLGAAPITIGRRPECSVSVIDPEVSGRHCEVSLKPLAPDAIVVDLKSTNGTFVNGERAFGTARLPVGAVLQVGGQLYRHEQRLRSEVAQAQVLDRDLEKASQYVQALLPEPIREGPVLTEWLYLPSAQLGGDALGHHQLDADCFAAFVIDVSGHGASAAMHSVSVMNVLRQRALPDTDFRDPAQVLRGLNAMFQMESHGGMFFTIWYGVYDAAERVLHYASAGHHPSYLVDAGRSAVQPLQTRNLVIGAMPETVFTAQRIDVTAGSRLYVFSDGVFEVETVSGRAWGLADFQALVGQPPHPGLAEPDRLYRAVQAAARPGAFDDDVTVLVLHFG